MSTEFVGLMEKIMDDFSSLPEEARKEITENDPKSKKKIQWLIKELSELNKLAKKES